MVKTHHKNLIGFVVLVIFLATLITSLFFISPEEIVNKIGARNGYLIAFAVSFFGGFSAGGSASFIGLLIVLAAGGLNPIFLGLVSGTSLAIGDMIMFYAGSSGRELIKGKLDTKIKRAADIVNKKEWLKKIIPVLAYLYIGFLPLPNDILILFLAAIEYPAKKMNTIIILGDLTFALMVTILAANGVSLIG